MENHMFFPWEKSLFRLGHFQWRTVSHYQRVFRNLGHPRDQPPLPAGELAQGPKVPRSDSRCFFDVTEPRIMAALGGQCLKKKPPGLEKRQVSFQSFAHAVTP